MTIRETGRPLYPSYYNINSLIKKPTKQICETSVVVGEERNHDAFLKKAFKVPLCVLFFLASGFGFGFDSVDEPALDSFSEETDPLGLAFGLATAGFEVLVPSSTLIIGSSSEADS